MANSGGQPGNTNAKRGRIIADCIRYSLAELGRDVEQEAGDEAGAVERGMRELTKQFVIKAKDGDLAAFREIADRTEGKSTQAIELGGPDGEPLRALLNYIPICPPDK